MPFLVITARAEEDLHGIWDSIVPLNEAAADNTLRKIHETAGIVAQYPNIGRERSDLEPGLFSFPSGVYLILYSFTDDVVAVARVLDGRRDIPAVFSEDSD